MLEDFKDWSDIDANFTKTSFGSIEIVESDECIRQSIKLILSTMRYERVRSELGTGLYRLLFEEVDDDTAEDIEDLIKTNLPRYENRIRVRDVKAYPNIDQSYYQLEIIYSILSTREKKKIKTYMPTMGDQ